MYAVYEILNLSNGKKYIGCSKDAGKRFSQHQASLSKNTHQNEHLQRSYNKHGLDSFKYSVICTFDDECDMYAKEVSLIKNSERLYNLAPGGMGGDTFTNRSEESKTVTRERLSIASKISNINNKDLHTENTTALWKDPTYRENVLREHKKATDNQEYRDKLSVGVKKALECPERRKVWSDCKKGRLNTNWKGRVIIFKGEAIEEYESLGEASKETGLNRDSISRGAKTGNVYKGNISEYHGYKFKLDKS